MLIQKARYLRDLAEQYDLHGLYFQHVALCRRRAWLHLAGATHAVHNSRVQRGLALHQIEKRPGEAPKGLGIAPDAIDFERRVVIERKGTAGATDAVSRQALFYAAFMTGAIGPEDKVLKLVCKNRHNVEVQRLSKEEMGGPMRQAEDEWHGKDWSIL